MAVAHLLDNVPNVFIVDTAQVEVPLVGLCLCCLHAAARHRQPGNFAGKRNVCTEGEVILRTFLPR